MTNFQDQPLVTICVPVYNGEKYLDECLNSIASQTYENWECVVNNNCSTDRSLEIARSFEKKDARFRVFTNESFIPVVPNWNKVFSHSNKDAKYFKMVQADDWIYPECIQKMVDLFESDPTIGICSSYRIDNIFTFPYKFNIREGKVLPGKEILYRHLARKLDIIGSITTVMFAMIYLKKLERFPMIFDEKNYHIDSELDFDIMYISNVGFVPQILSYTRRHTESGTHTIVHQLGTLHQHNEFVLSRYYSLNDEIPELYRKARLDYAYFYFKSLALHKTRIIEWHKKYYKGYFTFEEYLSSILTRNFAARLIKKIYHKFKTL